MEVDLYNRDNYVDGVPFEMFDHLRANQPVWWQEEPDGPEAAPDHGGGL